MTDANDKLFAGLTTIAVLGVMALSVAGWMLDAFVFRALWAWFLVPLGLPPIGLAHAFGVGLTGAMVAHQPRQVFGLGKEVTDSTVRPLLILALGWFVSRLM
jgi:hypothetical protein